MKTPSYKLTTGQLLLVETHRERGMAGEPSQRVILRLGSTPVRLTEVKHLLHPADANDIQEYLDDIAESNTISALSFCN